QQQLREVRLLRWGAGSSGHGGAGNQRGGRWRRGLHGAPTAHLSYAARVPAALPIDDVLPRLIAAVREHRAAVLVAPAGAGKTTRAPGALRDAGAITGDVVVLQPRRLAARLAAARVAHERGGELGREVGYEVRFDRRVSGETRIRFVTEGVLTRRLLSDP